MAHEGISSAVTAAGQRRSFTGFPNAVSVFLTLMSRTIVANKDSLGKAFRRECPGKVKKRVTYESRSP